MQETGKGVNPEKSTAGCFFHKVSFNTQKPGNERTGIDNCIPKKRN